MTVCICKGLDHDLVTSMSADFEFSLRLEPENKELKKQYVEAKDIYEKVCDMHQTMDLKMSEKARACVMS